jgi:hypothetical protein
MTGNASLCDHRLSRAAVHILREHLEPILRDHLNLDPLDSPAAERPKTTLWSMLQAVNASLNGNCSLYNLGAAVVTSSYTDWLDPERVGSAVPASTIASRRFSSRLALPHLVFLQSGRKKQQQGGFGHSRPPQYYQCALCGKVFTTRYYLDRHLDAHHLHEDSSSYICAADWCPLFLSMQRCHDVALELEPYYGPGSGEHSGSSNPGSAGGGGFKVKHRWFQRAHSVPCQDDVMARTRLRCENVIRDCFLSSSNPVVSQYLERFLCKTLSCHHRLHLLFQLVAGDRGRDFSRHDRRALSQTTSWMIDPASPPWTELDAWRHHRGVGTLGVIVFVVLLAMYSLCWIRRLHDNRRRVGRRHGSSSLPSRSSRASSYRKSSLGLHRSTEDPKKSL